MIRRKAGLALGRNIEGVNVAPDDRVRGVAEHALRALIPARDIATQIQTADGVIVHAVEQDAQPLLGLTEPFGLVVELRIERDHAAVRFREFVLQFDERPSQLDVFLDEFLPGYVRLLDRHGTQNTIALRAPIYRHARRQTYQPGGRQLLHRADVQD